MQNEQFHNAACEIEEQASTPFIAEKAITLLFRSVNEHINATEEKKAANIRHIQNQIKMSEMGEKTIGFGFEEQAVLAAKIFLKYYS